VLFSSRVRVRIRFSVWLINCYAHVFVLLSFVIVTLPHKGKIRALVEYLIPSDSIIVRYWQFNLKSNLVGENLMRFIADSSMALFFWGPPCT